MRKMLIMSASLVLFVVGMARPAAAQGGYYWGTVSDITYLTFSAPVQVPGAVLPAGTYVFRRIAPRVILVESKEGSTVYTAFMTIPRWRATAEARDEIVFGESPTCCAAPPVAMWFPAYRELGHEFLYPKAPSVHHVAMK